MAANRVEPRVTLVPMLIKHRDGSFLFCNNKEGAKSNESNNGANCFTCET